MREREAARLRGNGVGFLARVSIWFCSVGREARERRRIWAVGWRSSDGSDVLGGVIRGLSGSVLRLAKNKFPDFTIFL
jgi:hypothetical protein